MTKYRDHRGSLAESMKTVKEFATKQDLMVYLRKILPVSFQDSELGIHYYCKDERINWETYVVTIEGFGVVGFTDGDFGKEPDSEPPLDDIAEALRLARSDSDEGFEPDITKGKP